MASVNETKHVLEEYFATNWTYTPIKWVGVPFAPAQTSTGNRLPYVTMSHQESVPPGGGNVTLGGPAVSRFFRWTGIILNEVYIPENYPDAGLASTYLGYLTDLWNMHDFVYTDSSDDQAVCHVYVPWHTQVGLVSGWERFNHIAPYRRDSHS